MIIIRLKNKDQRVPIEGIKKDEILYVCSNGLTVKEGTNEIVDKAEPTENDNEFISFFDKVKNKTITIISKNEKENLLIHPAFEKYKNLLAKLIHDNVTVITGPIISTILGIDKFQAKAILKELEEAGIIKKNVSYWFIPKASKNTIRTRYLKEDIRMDAPIKIEKISTGIKEPRNKKEMMDALRMVKED